MNARLEKVEEIAKDLNDRFASTTVKIDEKIEEMAKAADAQAKKIEERVNGIVAEKFGQQNFRVLSEMRGKFLYYNPKTFFFLVQNLIEM